MAFDGPTPFDGDPVYDYLHEIEDATSEEIAASLRKAFERVAEGEEYYEIDETVWAWAAAELVAFALGVPADTEPPGAFGVAAKMLSADDARPIADLALAALLVVVDPSRSEAAELWNESGEETLAEHASELITRLEGVT